VAEIAADMAARIGHEAKGVSCFADPGEPGGRIE
jgi:hypothetical protein